VVPADLRLLEASGLECDEAVLTGESLAEPKTSEPARAAPRAGPTAPGPRRDRRTRHWLVMAERVRPMVGQKSGG
jgi:magnesium-transporting ATPase (P-type)